MKNFRWFPIFQPHWFGGLRQKPYLEHETKKVIKYSTATLWQALEGANLGNHPTHQARSRYSPKMPGYCKFPNQLLIQWDHNPSTVQQESNLAAKSDM